MLSRIALIGLVTALAAHASPLAQTPSKKSLSGSTTFSIHNNCQNDVAVKFNGTADAALPGGFTLSAGSTQSVQMPSSFEGHVLFPDTTQSNPENFESTAGFSLPNNYYWVTLNNGYSYSLQVKPDSAGGSSGYCGTASCNSPYCSGDNFGADVSGVPDGASDPAPSPPLYECPGGLTNYFLTTCFDESSSSSGPYNPVWQIHPNGDTSKCIDVQGNVQADGTPVQIYDCNGSDAQKWQTLQGKMQLAGTNFCLDATDADPANGTKMKIWTCYDNLAQQAFGWNRYGNNIDLQNTDLCLDLTNGDESNGNQLQVWECASGNANQLWTHS